jgi:hypothetical protein
VVPPEQRARSDAYFEGGYWLILWDFVAIMTVGAYRPLDDCLRIAFTELIGSCAFGT